MACCCGIGKSRTVQYWVGKLLQSGYTLTASSPTSKTQPANQKKKTAFHSRGHTPKLSVSCLHAISVVLCKHLAWSEYYACMSTVQAHMQRSCTLKLRWLLDIKLSCLCDIKAVKVAVQRKGLNSIWLNGKKTVLLFSLYHL